MVLKFSHDRGSPCISTIERNLYRYKNYNGNTNKCRFKHALDMTLCAHITINKNGYFMAHPRQCTVVVPDNNIDLAGSNYLYRC